MEDVDFSNELRYSATRSSGAGGQNVNKVNTKVELRFSVLGSLLLTEEQKAIIANKLSTRMNEEGELVLTSQSERSQLGNKEQVTEKFYKLITKALIPVKKRKKTRPTAASKQKKVG